MTNKTFIPAFQAQVGDWKYYICVMKYAEVARQVQFAYELGGNQDLGKMIQRGISARTEEIRRYLLESEHRFLGALIVAAWGGDPMYTQMTMEDPDGMLAGIDQGFGVLTFDGTQSYFALDGQHRLRAIKDAIREDPELGDEDICVLMVSHFDTEEGREKTRRLFTNINRNAKPTKASENIALDEDDGFAILARRFLQEHSFLKQKGRVKVFTGTGDDGEVKLAQGSVSKTDAFAVTTMSVLYDMLRDLNFDLPESLSRQSARPNVQDLDEAFTVLAERLDQLLEHCGKIREKLESALSARDLRSPKDAEYNGHPFMRPVVQKAVVRAARQIVEQQQATYLQVMAELSKLDWRMGQAPFVSVFDVEGGKMISGKDFSNLLESLLRVHVAPPSEAEIKRVRKVFRSLRGFDYPVSLDELKTGLDRFSPS